MVAIDSGVQRSPVSPTRFSLFLGRLPLAGLIGAAAALSVLGAMAARGFSDNGFRLGSQIGWRFACFVFFAAAIAGPLCRLVPLGICRPLGALRRQLIWGFCASYGVFLASVLLPNLLGAGPLGLGAGIGLFVLFGGFLTAAMAYGAARQSASRLGPAARRAFVTTGGGFFWLLYALTGLARIAGPHRPDAFYGVSLGLMLLALLLRFADRLVARLRGTPEPEPL